MGKTSIKTIDDSVVEVKEDKPVRPAGGPRKKVNPSPEEMALEKKKVNPNPELMEKKTKKINPNPEDLKKDSPDVILEGAKRPIESQGDAIASLQHDKAKATPKQGKKVRSKKFVAAQEKVDRAKSYPINEATELIKEVSYTKFDGTLEIHINTAVKGVRGLISLPFASGKKLNILAFGKGAEESGADLIGDDEALKEIEKGKINFDVLVTTADWMPKLARAAKILGPKGLMPNPKNGTISSDLKKTVAELQGGKVEYKSEAKANVIHLGIGKVTQPADELSQNIKVLLSTIGKTKIKKAVISPTMGPSIKLDLSSL